MVCRARPDPTSLTARPLLIDAAGSIGQRSRPVPAPIGAGGLLYTVGPLGSQHFLKPRRERG